ncbi:glutathione S-transferase N-terminal domain-containing protein [Acidocella sp.]|uniref:glutathione S-transferase N-terminal domain-containing protein n=1 Tax=Acidocella sp. TaxID=50710 RepID=UPI0026332875|nr:glutathione S-transferase N-terminal domain-containing protein [Acidocella sp.]MDD2794759.1 glutathione S-transferase N-terminal domain-containing protein [Acidocella sp.]
MKLFYSPGACSIGIQILLREIGKPFELVKTDLHKGAQHTPEFLAVNPKAKVPVLQRDDASILTEFPAIAIYLARTNPDKNLLPSGLEGEVRTLELLDYMVATIHMRGFARLMRPGMFSTTPGDEDKIRQTGREIVLHGFANLQTALGGKPYLFGDFSIADAALFYLEFWARNRAQVPLPANLDAHLDRMLARPGVQSSLAAEGLA